MNGRSFSYTLKTYPEITNKLTPYPFQIHQTDEQASILSSTVVHSPTLNHFHTFKVK